MTPAGVAVADDPFVGARRHAELDRGGVLLEFPRKSAPTASSSGTVVDALASTFGSGGSESAPTLNAAAYEALSAWSNALTSDSHKWVTTANDFNRANVAGMRVYVSPEAVANATNDVLWSGYFGFGGSNASAWRTSDAWFEPLAISPVNVDREVLYRRAALSLDRSRENLLEGYLRQLDASTAPHAQAEPGDVVDSLTREHGVGQLVIAQALGVSPTAVRKWRRREAATPGHRGRLARFAGLIDLLDESGVHDPGGWLCIPVSDRGTLRPLEMFSAGRADLVLLLASQIDEPHDVLDLFDPRWRENFGVDEEYDVIEHADGSRSAVPRR